MKRFQTKIFDEKYYNVPKEKRSYTIVADDLANSGVFDDNDTEIVNNPTRDGYTFMGWTGTGLDIPQKSVAIAIGSTGNRSYVANWAENTVSVTISKDDHFWSDSGMSVGLYQNGVEKYSTVVTSGNTATFNRVEAGEYDVYAGKNSNDKTTMVDTGQDVQVGE